MRLMSRLLCLSLSLVVCPSIALAQSFTGTIIGTLKDTSGAVIPGASITIINEQTDRRESATTDVEGRYTSVPLPPGEYRVEAGIDGFRRAVRRGPRCRSPRRS